MDKGGLDNELDALMAEAEAERDENLGQGESNEHHNNDNIITTGDNADSGNNDNSDDEIGNEEARKAESENQGAQESNENEGAKSGASDGQFTPVEVETNGQKVTLETKEEVAAYEANAENKYIDFTQDNANNSNAQNMVSQAEISDADIQLLADVKAGKPGALKKLAENNKVDLADADDFEGDYTPEFTPKQATPIDIVINNIEANAELSAKFNQVVNTLPQEFLNVIGANAQDLSTFANHVNSGLAQELLPIAAKNAATKGGSLLDNYIALGESKSKTTQKKDSEQNRNISEKEKNLRNRASDDADANKGGGNSAADVDDIWAMSEKDLMDIDLRTLV